MKTINLSIVIMLCAVGGLLPALFAQQGLVINEFMADNDNVVIDTTDNSYDDWLEIYNSSSSVINLNNYFLTDNSSLPDQWQFPDITIAPGEFLLVWADDDIDAVGLHTNFKLSKSGEFLGLYLNSDQSMIAIDTFTFGVQTMNVSYGRYPDGSANWQSFTIPTPGKPNSITQDVDSSAVIFDVSKVNNYTLHFYVTDWADSLEYNYEHGEVYMPAQLTYENIVLDSVGVRYKGNSSYMMSRSTPKKPFKFKFDKFKKGRTFYDIKELNFSNCVKDPSFMREKLSYDIFRKYVPASRTAYANIYVDGELIGFYVQVEEVDKKFLAKYFQNNNSNLYKASDDGTTLAYLGTDPTSYYSGLELKTNEDENDWTGLIQMLDKLNNTPAGVFKDTMENYLNLDICCRLLALNMVLSNFDSYTGSGRNFYLYDDLDAGQFQMIPWDLNESFGAYTNNWNVITVDILNVPNLAQRPLNRTILENSELRQLYLSYINDMILGPASYDSVSAVVEQLKVFVEPYIQADNNKLYSYQNFLNNIEKDVNIDLGIVVPGIKSFSQKRNENLKTQLAGYIEVAVAEENSVTPTFKLEQNYPNPFNPNTTILLSLDREANVKLEIFNIMGQRVATLVTAKLPAGHHQFLWQATMMSSGIFYCAMQVGQERHFIKMLLLK